MPADYVTTEEGTGLVHLAPAFGEIDRQIGRENGLPSLNPVGPDGRFTDDDRVAGRAATSARPTTTSTTASRRRACCSAAIPYVHSYPHCWRCRTPLIYWGKPSWYIATSTRKDDLLAANATVDWHPAYIRDGRFGEWLANNVDWALSRDRYWGTPLPIWRCGRGHLRCVGSLAELSDLCGRDVTGHRSAPAGHRRRHVRLRHVRGRRGSNDDELAVARRVEPVIDAWFDSGSMPAAQVGYPHAPGSAEAFTFPADFISEAIDQTRGWFYSLLAVNTLVFGESPYRHVVCLGPHRRRRRPQDVQVARQHHRPLDDPRHPGRRRLRWWMFSQGSPWTPTRASLGAIDTAMRDMLLTLWNTFSFFTTYASLNDVRPGRRRRPAGGRARPARPLDPVPPGQHDGDGDRRRSRPTSRSTRPRPLGPPGRRPLQLVRAPQPPPLLAHRPRRAGRRHPGRAGHAARGPDHAVAPAGAALPVRGRHHVAAPHRGRRRPSRCTWPTGPAADAGVGSTRTSRRRWRWPAA